MKQKKHFNKNEAGSGRCGVERKRRREGKLGRGYRRADGICLAL